MMTTTIATGNSNSTVTTSTSLVRFFASIADFWTDLLFVVILYFESQRKDTTQPHSLLFIICITWIGFAYLFSCVLGVYWIHRMRVTIARKTVRSDC